MLLRKINMYVVLLSMLFSINKLSTYNKMYINAPRESSHLALKNCSHEVYAQFTFAYENIMGGCMTLC